MRAGTQAGHEPMGRLEIMAGADGEDPAVVDARVVESSAIGELWKLELEAPALAARSRPGQFVMLTVRSKAGSPTLPRPMALYDWDLAAGTVTVVYRVVGSGTAILSRARPGDVLTLVGPLGKAFQLRDAPGTTLLLGRGIGSCSLLSVARAASAGGAPVVAVLSGRNGRSIVPPEEFARAGAGLVLAVTDRDGDSEVARVETRLRALGVIEELSQIYCCGASRFLSLAARLAQGRDVDIQVSIEAHMACGLGYCHGCAAPMSAHEEAPLVCRDGPCFRWVPDSPR